MVRLGSATLASRPRKRHASFAAPPKASRRVVRVLAGILRIAAALDRHSGRLPEPVVAQAGSRVIVLRCAVPFEGGVDRRSILQQARPLARALKRRLGVEVSTEILQAARAS